MYIIQFNQIQSNPIHLAAIRLRLCVCFIKNMLSIFQAPRPHGVASKKTWPARPQRDSRSHRRSHCRRCPKLLPWRRANDVSTWCYRRWRVLGRFIMAGKSIRTLVRGQICKGQAEAGSAQFQPCLPPVEPAARMAILSCACEIYRAACLGLRNQKLQLQVYSTQSYAMLQPALEGNIPVHGMLNI